MYKTCKQCGSTKAEVFFRRYYETSSSARYKICFDCEKINSRRKYLVVKSKKSALAKIEVEELDTIDNLYCVQRAQGLAPPKPRGAVVGVLKQATDMLQLLNDVESTLGTWLECDLTIYAPEELSDIYDTLKDKYRPKVGLDPATSLPIHDDTHKGLLNKILERFDKYEEDYYNEVE